MYFNGITKYLKLKITFETQKSHFKCDFGSRVSHLKRIFPRSNVILDFQSGACSTILTSTESGCYPLTLPLRTIGLASRLLPLFLFQIAFFEKNEKEPKKKAKRTEKERNSVTTSVSHPVSNPLFLSYLSIKRKRKWTNTGEGLLLSFSFEFNRSNRPARWAVSFR